MSRAIVALVLLATLGSAGLAPAQEERAAAAGPRRLALRVAVSPSTTRLGEPLVYSGIVTGGGPGALRVFPPDSGGDLDWGAARIRARGPGGEPRRPGAGGWYPTSGPGDSFVVEMPLRVFRTGVVSVPGLRLELSRGGAVTEFTLPTAQVFVAPVIPAGDTAASLRPLRGPFTAPWWERVPWRLVAAGLLALAAGLLVLRRLRRRRGGPVPAHVVEAKDPALEALEALQALRGLHLPEHGRFAEHAFHLTRILRRLLEATEGTPRPGDSTPELLRHLEAARLAPADLERLASLLAAWDRVKFARAATTPEEARRAEDAVEDLARRRAPAAGREAA